MIITIEIDPQTEAQLRRKAEARQVPVDSYVQEVLQRVTAEEDDEATWQELYRREMSEKIDRGIAQMDRGEGLTANQVREWMAGQKANWRREKLKSR